uniref:Cleavage/polyadenylation specificity factor A subunit C-terminal domain-containing protein n=1 Tax=Ascaris lumbricoides TaxID=6252 RepID=A0A9J2PBZ7_ASCLU
MSTPYCCVRTCSCMFVVCVAVAAMEIGLGPRRINLEVVLVMASGMYTILHETDDSTTVNFSEYGKFLPGNGMQLVTVGAKHLRLHRPNPYALVPETDKQWNQTTRLECIIHVRLLAPVKSLAVARIPQNPSCSSLLLGFDTAKLSVVGFSAAERSLKTISLHCFEEEMLKDGYVTDLPSPVIRVDPAQRCAVMLIYGRYLAVLPFDDTSPHLHTYTVALSSIDPRLVNIIDIAFLDGYYEPTLLFLYEPAQTTAGRACVRYDTVCMLGVSLNTKEQVHASVWQLNNLPMDCNQVLMIPRPIGGALIIGANELIYLNQSVPPCGSLLNSCMDGFTKFPLKSEKEMALTLDGCAACVISTNKVVVCARSGALFILTLVVDSTNSVKSIEFKHEFDVSIPHTVTACSPGYLFVGSRVGDSLFIEYVSELVPVDDPIEKKLKVEVPQDDLEDEDLELYGKALPSVISQDVSVEKMRFRVLDRMLNVAPCKKMTSGCSEGLNSYLQEQPRLDPVFDRVCACGHGKDSSICIFQQSIRPDIITSSSIEGVIQYWAVGRREDDTHMYIIASKELGSLALETDNDLVELEAPVFITSESTIAAGELADGGLSVQVTTSSIVVVAEGQQIQLIPLQLTFPVLSASIVDPFVAICTQNGRLLLYELDNTPHVHLKAVDLPGNIIHNKSPITALCIYRDMSGTIRFCSSSSAASHGANAINTKQHIDIDDFDDMLLYGDSKNKQKEAKKKRKIVGTRQNPGETPHLETDVVDPNTIVPSHWIVMARENGNLYIYSIPEMQLVYMVKKLSHLPDVAIDEMNYLGDESVVASDIASNTLNEALVAKPEEIIVEVLLTGMGMNQGRPMLFVVVDDMVSVYEMFMYDNGVVEHLAVRFKRLPYTTVTRSCRFQGNDGRAPVEAARDTVRYRTALHPFERIGNILNGVFICSSYPCVFLMDSGILRMHPLNLEGPILSFTAFNNVLCPNGFIYLTEREWAMRIAKLPTDVELDSSLPVRKIRTGRTIHNIVYLLQSNTYAVVGSEKKPNNRLCVLVNEDKSFDEHEKADSFVLPELEVYDVKLYSPEDWKPVPNAEIKMEDFEVLTCCEEVVLRSEGTVSGVQNYLAVGTACNYGEEVLVRGRIIISEIIEVVPEPGQPTSKHRIKTLYDKEQKGPVTSLCSCNGYLLAGMGQKVFIWLFRDNNLQGISFLDMHFYIHQLVGVRNLALACDIYRSVALLRYQEEYKALSLASRDMRAVVQPPMAAQFLIDNRQMAFIMSDEAANIAVFNYLPEALESSGGERLILRSEINIGTNVNSFMRVKGHISSGFVENEHYSLNRQSVLFCSLDGSFGFVRPLSEKVFRRLHMLQQLMSSLVAQAAGLNVKGSRAARPQRPNHYLNTRNMVDGDVVFQYLHLSLADKNDLARKLGTSRYHIIDDLTEISRLTTHY